MLGCADRLCVHGNGQWWDKGATVCVQFASLAQKRFFFYVVSRVFWKRRKSDCFFFVWKATAGRAYLRLRFRLVCECLCLSTLLFLCSRSRYFSSFSISPFLLTLCVLKQPQLRNHIGWRNNPTARRSLIMYISLSSPNWYPLWKRSCTQRTFLLINWCIHFIIKFKKGARSPSGKLKKKKEKGLKYVLSALP